MIIQFTNNQHNKTVIEHRARQFITKKATLVKLRVER